MLKCAIKAINIIIIIAPHIKHTSINVLSQIQEFIITLIKLKINSPFQDLVHVFRFGISVSTVSRVFDEWIDAISTHLQFLACVQNALLSGKNVRRGVCDLPLLILYGGHVIFPRMCGK